MDRRIDNFKIVGENILRFDREGEFYMVLVLRRRKDVDGKVVEGVNEDNRLIKHFFIYDKEYFERKRQAIINLCEQNNARAYILPQRRSHDIVMWALHNKTGEVLKSSAKNTHFDHLIRSCVAGIHEVPPDAKWHKRWVIDIDADEEECISVIKEWNKNSSEEVVNVEFYADWLVMMLRGAFAELYGLERSNEAKEYMPKVGHTYVQDDIVLLRTPHGFHIVTPPFNREAKAMEKYFGRGCPKQGWIKPDAMALLYSPSSIDIL